MSVAVSIFIAVIIFALIIFIHELGHFLAAKLFKMRVYEFNLGMGPVLFRKRGKETNYQIKAIPFGGSCRLGEDEDIGDDDPKAFRNKPVWQRMIVILAGAFMNIVLGFILCIIIVGTDSMVGTTTIRGFYEGASSNKQLRADDQITHINGMRIFTFADISYQLYNTEVKMAEDERVAAFDFVVIRDGERLELKDVPFKTHLTEEGKRAIFLDFARVWVDKTFGNVMVGAAKETFSYSRLVIMTLGDMINGTLGLNEISGPVGAVSAIGEVSSAGFEYSFFDGIWNSLFMAALISVNVAIFNLLPIPALDGARFFFFVVEAIRRKPVKPEVEGMIHFVGFAALMVFMLFITVLDIGKLFA